VIAGVIVGERAASRSNCRGCAFQRPRRARRPRSNLERGLAQAVLKPGERAWFKSRLASRPPKGAISMYAFFIKRISRPAIYEDGAAWLACRRMAAPCRAC